MEPSISLSTTFSDTPLVLRGEPFPLQLCHSFGTSHSVSTTRTNFLFSVDLNGIKGFGEAGLPPKKPLCYVADVEDCLSHTKKFLQKVKDHLEQNQSEIDFEDYDPFSQVEDYFECWRLKTKDNLIYRLLLWILDGFSVSNYESLPPFKCAVECAILDAWAKKDGIMVYEAIFGSDVSTYPKKDPVSFYTVAMSSDIVETAQLGGKYTNFLKIKVDADVSKALKTMETLTSTHIRWEKWSIDANAAWTPTIALEFLDRIQSTPFRDMIYMVEQPFPLGLVNLGPSVQKEWMHVKNEYGKVGIPIYADESVAHENDVEFLSGFCHGVNMKLEKGGGIRSTLKVVCKAKEHDLSLWFGVMVGSALNANMSAQLAWISGIGDWDGGLLVRADRFGGGFEWGKGGHMIFPSSHDTSHPDLHLDSHRGFGVFELQ